MVATTGGGDMSLASLANSAGAGPQITEYLEARGIRTTPTLALISNDRETFISQIVQPLLDGYQKGTTRITLESEEKPIAQAVLEHMWREAQLQWQRRQAVVPLAPAAATPGTAAPSHGSTTAPNVPAVEKPPKQLPSQVWQRQVSRYNNVTVDGRPRRFPEKEVLGAEAILGRIYHEHVVNQVLHASGIGRDLAEKVVHSLGRSESSAETGQIGPAAPHRGRCHRSG